MIPMQYSSPISAPPVALSQSTESKVYGLFAIAMAITVVGVFIGMQYAAYVLTTGIHIFFAIAELAIIFTAPFWMEKSPLNYLLFFLFPLLSGITVTPYLMHILVGYANGGAILANALAATAFTTAAMALFAKTTSWNLGVLGKGLFFALIGLIVLMLLQFFVPAFQTTQFELMLSGAGIVIFALFTAYDIQRIGAMGRAGANPFILAISLYLDIFNLFLYLLRFMAVLGGERR